MNIGTVYAEGTLKALALHAHDRGITPKGGFTRNDAQRISELLKLHVKNDLYAALDEIKDIGIDTVPEQLLRSLLNTYINATAAKVLSEFLAAA